MAMIKKILKACRDIHLINMKPITLIPDINNTPIPITVNILSAADNGATVPGTTLFTCDQPHFLVDGSSVTLADMTVSTYNGSYQVKVIDEESFYAVVTFNGTSTGQFGSFDGSNFDNLEGRALISAVDKYNKDVPWRQIVVFQGQPNTTRYYLDTLVPGWDSLNWKIDRIQYPYNSSITTPVNNEFIMNSNYWRQTIDGTLNRPILQFVNNQPTMSNLYNTSYPSMAFGVWYIKPHIFDYARNFMTIPDIHCEAIANLAASKVLRSAASKAAAFGDKGGPGLESKDLGQQITRFRECQKEAERMYAELIANEEPAFGPYWQNWELDSPTGFRDFHPPEIY